MALVQTKVHENAHPKLIKMKRILKPILMKTNEENEATYTGKLAIASKADQCNGIRK